MLDTSLQVLAVWWMGDALHGVVALLNTPAGQLAAQLLRDGHRLGASARCWTSLEHTYSIDAFVTQDDCLLITSAST